MKKSSRSFVVWTLLFVAVAFAIYYWVDKDNRMGARSDSQTYMFSDFLNEIKNDPQSIRKVVISGDKVIVEKTDGPPHELNYIPGDGDLTKELTDKGVPFDIKLKPRFQWLNVFGAVFPLLFFIGFIVFMSRQMQGAGNRALSFGKSRAKAYVQDQPEVTFDDVAGCEEAKDALAEIIEFLKEPAKFQKLGGRIPKGILLVGPPGTGKTLLAKAVAGEAGVPFFTISGSDFVEMFVGVGASRVRDLFEQGKKNAPCIIFIDELDAVGRHRGAGIGGGHDEREQTLNQLLVAMDGFDTSGGVIVIAATNRPDVLDPALLRAGRFDQQVVVDLPDMRGREEILKVHTKGKPIEENVDLARLARGTPSFAGSDLQNVVNTAALLAAKRGLDAIDMPSFEEAKDRVMMGPERRSLVISDRERRLTAIHEAGHALVAHHHPHADPNYKVSIIPRGRGLGVTVYLPNEDRHTHTKDQLMGRICCALGGRIAEEVVFGQQTTGAQNDFMQATDMARRMVCEFGMSDKVGPLAYRQREEQVFLGRDIASHKGFSEQTAILIDQEIRNVVETAWATASGIIEKHIDDLRKLAEELLDKETLDTAQIEQTLGPKPVQEPSMALRPESIRLEEKSSEPPAEEDVDDDATIISAGGEDS